MITNKKNKRRFASSELSQRKQKFSKRNEEIKEIQEELQLSVLSSNLPSQSAYPGSEFATDTRSSMDSLSSLSSAGSRQLILFNGKPHKDFSKLNIQSNYDARRESAKGISEIMVEDEVSIYSERKDLSKSMRDILRDKRRPQINYHPDPVARKLESTSKTISNVTDMKKTKGLPASMRIFLFCVVIIMFAVGIALIIYFVRKINSPALITSDTAVCITEGVYFGRQITFVCNTTVKTVSGISVHHLLNASTLEKYNLTCQNQSSDGWNMSCTSQDDKTIITILGPPANCSSAGEYNITITSNSTSFLRKINLDVRGNLTLNVSNSTCSDPICQSTSQCERGYEQLYLHPGNITSTLSINLYYCKSSLDWYECIAHCNGTILPDVTNSSINCTQDNT